MQTTPSENKIVGEIEGIQPGEAVKSLPPASPVRRTGALFILPASLALIMTGFGIIIPVFPQRLQALGLGAETLALMEGAFGLGTFLFSTPMGVMANRFGRKPLILFALIGFVLTNLTLALVNAPLLFVLVRFLEGMFVAGFFPAAMSMVGDAVPFDRQGRWMGWITTAQASGIALGPAIGGILYQSWGFYSPFFLSSGFALIAAVLAFFLLPETLPEQVKIQALKEREAKRSGVKRQSGSASPLWALVWLYAALLFIDFGSMFIYPFSLPQYPFFFAKVLHYGTAQYGLIISAYGLSLAVFPSLLGRIIDLLPKKTLVIVGSLLSTALNLAMLLSHQYLILIVASLLTGLGSALLMPALGTIYLNASTDENRSQLMGIRSTAISMALLVAPLAQAIAGPWISPQITFGIAAGISIAMTVFVIVALKDGQRERPVLNS